MQKDYGAIEAEGAEVIAISSDTPKEAKRAAEESKARFPVLSDPELKAIAPYNTVDPLFRRDARPVTYVIDKAGIIRWKFLDVRIGDRIATVKVIDELKKL